MAEQMGAGEDDGGDGGDDAVRHENGGTQLSWKPRSSGSRLVDSASLKHWRS